MLKAVLDIGKTHIKLLLVKNGKECASFSCKNAPIEGMYPQADVDGIWNWLTETLRSCSLTPQIQGFVVTTHGATAALINDAQTREDALVLPVLDYEFAGIEACLDDYQKVRPDFEDTLSPALPAGLNLGRQLFWLQSKFAEQFSSATTILMYPQYWAWRLGATMATEVTSLGCHTDMWNPQKQDYSTLISACGWQEKLPELRNAWDCLGQVSEDVAKQTGLSQDCEIFAGIHDSNASLLRYLSMAQDGESFNVISTGTWTILMQVNGSTETLAKHRDTLANVDIHRNPVSCARFMGGREYEKICTTLGGNIRMSAEAADIQRALDEGWMVTPDFSQGNGPFGGLTPQLLCPASPEAPQAIATLYCALLIDQRLNDLNSTGTIYIEGAFLKNPMLCQLVSQLRPQQKVMLSRDNTGTVMGAASLVHYNSNEQSALDVITCEPAAFDGLEAYRAKWFSYIN